MTAKIKNIIIFGVIILAFVLIYIFFIRKAPEQASLTSSSGGAVPSADTSANNSSITKDFLSLLLNVKNIKLDVSIFSDPAFTTLHDSSIVLTPDGTEGRINPFAPIGSDSSAPPASNTNNPAPAPALTPSSPNSPVKPH